MKDPPSPPPLRSDVRTAPWIAVFLIAAVSAIVVLPAVLLYVARPLAPGAPQTGQQARSYRQDRSAPEHATATRPEAVSSTDRSSREHSSAEAGAARPTSEQSRGTGGGDDAPDGPIVERRWVRGGDTTPSSAPARPSVLDAGQRESEFDRSAESRRRRVQRFGGSALTEDAVEIGLGWLAAHQSPDGSWSRTGFSQQCPRGDRCPGAAVSRTDSSLKAGVTGLALLAFLGAGYSDRVGPHQDVVARAVAALLAMQQRHGGFSSSEAMAGYNDALATFALAEYHAMTRDPRLVDPLERAVQRLLLSQQRFGGWDYTPRPASGRNDTSITAWVVQALRACAAAGIDVPRRSLVRAALHFSRAVEPDGRVWYSDAGTGFTISSDAAEPIYRYGPAMTAAGLTCEYLLGWRIESEAARRQQALLLGQLPSARVMQLDQTSLHSYYYWYYGTIAMFQTGGEAWTRWNANLRDNILPLQDRSKSGDGGRRHSYGSWPPFESRWGKWGRMGSRVYTTAICVLTLETYYRHMPAYLADAPPLAAADWRALLDEADGRQARWAIEALRATRVEIAEPVLIDLLDGDSRTVALAVAEALVSIDSPVGRSVLENALPALPEWERRRYERVLRVIDELDRLPPVHGTVRVYDPERRLATVELPRCYVGMRLSVTRGDQTTGEMSVVQRFTGRDVAVAELVLAPAGLAPRAGDSVISK